jgi:RHS repeat-associated protein
VFGEPHLGDFGNGVGLGYTGKPYDPVTGLYDYGYRDYMPAAARFTTEDPVRDGANWFAYVNNDPVNYIDLWGLNASDVLYGYGDKPGTNISLIQNTNATIDVVIVGSGAVGSYAGEYDHIFADGPIMVLPEDVPAYKSKTETIMGGLSGKTIDVTQQTNIRAVTNTTTQEDIDTIKTVGGTIYYSKDSSPGPGGTRPNMPNKFIYISPVLRVQVNPITGNLEAVGVKRSRNDI